MQPIALPARTQQPPRPRLAWLWAVAAATGLAALASPAQATYQLTGLARSHAVMTSPLPGSSQTDSLDLNLLNQAGATQLQRLDTFASTVHGSATALFAGRIGLLRAYAASDYERCCLGSTTVHTGDADAAVQGSFYDELQVFGAGLALGTPVRYQLDLRIDGTVSSPSVESGGWLSVYVQAQAGLRDVQSGQAVNLRWEAGVQPTGVHSLVLDTQVGHTLALSGGLQVGAHVSAGAITARSAVADFYNSAGFTLAPSVAGLNTVGDSGTNFLASPVPEPASAGLLVLGGAGLLAWRRRRGVRRSGRPAC